MKKLSSQKANKEDIHKIPFKQKAYFGTSVAGATFINSMIEGSLLKYYTDFIAFPAVLFGIAQLFYAIWNAIDDPILGYLSDKTTLIEGKGKRKRWMWLSIPLMILGFFLVILVHPVWNHLTIFLILLIGLAIFDTGFATFGINRASLMVSITGDDSERSSLVVVSLIFQSVLGIFSYVLPLYFLTGQTPIPIITIMYTIVGIIAAGFLTSGVQGIQEPSGIYGETGTLQLKSVLKEMFRSRTYIFYLVYLFLMNAVAATQLTFMLFYIEEVTQTTGALAVLLSAIAFPAIFISYFLIQFINKKLGVRQTLMIFLTINIVGLFGLLLVSKFWLAAIFYICTYTGAAAHWVLSLPLMGNIIDEYELRTKKRNEGTFFGINAIFLAPSVSIMIFIFTQIITISGYEGTAPFQTPKAILGIKLGATLVPLMFVIVALLLVRFYPLRGKKLEELKKQVNILYESKLKRSKE